MSCGAERIIYSDTDPVAIAAAPDLVFAAYADGVILCFPGTGPFTSKPAYRFEAIYPCITQLTYSAWHDTVITIENRRSDPNGVVRIYYNWRAGTVTAPYTGEQYDHNPVAPLPSKRVGGKRYPVAKELSVYRLHLPRSANKVSTVIMYLLQSYVGQ